MQFGAFNSLVEKSGAQVIGRDKNESYGNTQYGVGGNAGIGAYFGYGNFDSLDDAIKGYAGTGMEINGAYGPVVMGVSQTIPTVEDGKRITTGSLPLPGTYGYGINGGFTDTKNWNVHKSDPITLPIW